MIASVVRCAWGMCFGLALGLACNGGSGFTCEDAGECMDGATQGRCEPNGYCSFPNPACVSGYEYGELAAEGLAGECTAPPEGTGGTTAGTDAGTGGPVSSTGGADSSTSSPVADGTSSGTTAADAGESSGTTGEAADPDLILWLKMDDPAGDGALDSSIYGHEPTCVDCPASVPGMIADAYLFDDSSTYFQLPADPRFDLTSELTLAAWIEVPFVDTNLHTVIARPVGSGSANSWELLLRDSGNGCGECIRFGVGPAASPQYLDDVAPVGRWFHAAGTWDGATIRLWIDGVMVDETAQAEVDYDAAPIMIGADLNSFSLAGVFHGSLDDVRVYRRALSPAEIAALAAGG